MPPKSRKVVKIAKITKSELVGLGLTHQQIKQIPKKHHLDLAKHVMKGGSFSSFFNKIKDGIVSTANKVKDGVVHAANKVKDVMLHETKLPGPVKDILRFANDVIIPVNTQILRGFAESGVPGVSQLGMVGSVLGDLHSKIIPPGSLDGAGLRKRVKRGKRGGRANAFDKIKDMIDVTMMKSGDTARANRLQKAQNLKNQAEELIKTSQANGGKLKRKRLGGKMDFDLNTWENQAKMKGGKGRVCKMCGSAGTTAKTCPLNPDALHRRWSKHPQSR